MRKILAAAGALSAAAVITGSSLPAASAAAHHTTAKTESFRLVSRVVSGRGAGRYAHLTGHGTFAAHILAVLRRNKKGRCSQSKQPQALQQVINAHGPVSGV